MLQLCWMYYLSKVWHLIPGIFPLSCDPEDKQPHFESFVENSIRKEVNFLRTVYFRVKSLEEVVGLEDGRTEVILSKKQYGYTENKEGPILKPEFKSPCFFSTYFCF